MIRYIRHIKYQSVKVWYSLSSLALAVTMPMLYLSNIYAHTCKQFHSKGQRRERKVLSFTLASQSTKVFPYLNNSTWEKGESKFLAHSQSKKMEYYKLAYVFYFSVSLSTKKSMYVFTKSTQYKYTFPCGGVTAAATMPESER